MKQVHITFLLCTLLLSAGTATASSKPNPRDGREDEAKNVCFDALKYNSKDPDSLVLHEDTATWTVGQGIVQKHILWITVEGRGKNSYGAVLEHTFTCAVKCAKVDQPCRIDSIQDDPR